MTETGMSLFLADTNGLEAVHSALNKSDQRHGCRVTHAQVSRSAVSQWYEQLLLSTCLSKRNTCLFQISKDLSNIRLYIFASKDQFKFLRITTWLF